MKEKSIKQSNFDTDEIKKDIEDKKILLFVGAGISKNSGLPLANELKKSILQKLVIDKRKKDVNEDIQEIMNSELPFEAFMETIEENSDISNILNNESSSIKLFSSPVSSQSKGSSSTT